jgi:hypothetical protein
MGRIYVLEDLKSPAVKIEPPSGVFREDFTITMETGNKAAGFFRIFTTGDSIPQFIHYEKPVLISGEGIFTFEYYAKDIAGYTSPIRMEKYLIDLTPPRLQVYTEKGKRDSIILVNFSANENVTIYYTLDGTDPTIVDNPLVAANKFFSRQDVIEVLRTRGLKLRFFGEDVANNRSSLIEIDLGAPTVIPGIPAGIYSSLQTVALNTLDKTRIYYTRDGSIPDISSLLYNTPLTLTKTTLLKFFAIDETGFRSATDSAFFEIDLPPIPDFTFPDIAYYPRDTIRCNAAISVDEETPLRLLRFRWDWDDDGVFDTPFSQDTAQNCRYRIAGLKTMTLEVEDEKKQVRNVKKKVLIRHPCPKDMISVAMGKEQSFCIDTYEWPNLKGRKPLTGVSWIEALIYCRDMGKRLCSAKEWSWSCSGTDSGVFPYGTEYNKETCNTETGAAEPSGQRNGCNSYLGVKDMTGNVWEWIDHRQENHYYMAGGSSSTGSYGNCTRTFPGNISQEDPKVGFRCCK